MAEIKFMNKDNLLYVWQKIKLLLSNKVDKVEGKGLSTNDLTDELKTKILNAGDSSFSGDYTDLSSKPSINGVELAGGENTLASLGIQASETGKGLSTNDYTTTEKNKLKGISEGAEVNKIDSIKVNGTVQTITSKSVNIKVPTNNNELTNGAGYQTELQVTEAIEGKGYQTASEVDSAITAKGYQTASQVDTAITGKGYQTSSQVSSAISTAIAGVTQFDYSIVDTLPSTGKKGTIYLVANNGTGNNIYDEYLWINSKWELFGTTEIDLSGYVKSADLVAITNAEIDTIFAS